MRYTTWYSMAEVNKLRTQYKTFTYQDYSWKLLDGNNLKVNFVFTIGEDIVFDPSLTIHNVTQQMIDRLGAEAISNYVFHIGMAELYSYWKTTASPEIIIKSGKLSQEAILFWHKLLLKGMGEFFYTNKIDFTMHDFVTFISDSDNEHAQTTNRDQKPHSYPIKNTDESSLNSNTKVLVPVGGGKDSVVSLEILKEYFDVGTFIVSTPQSAQDIINVSNIPQEKQIKISRILDPKIFELNTNGFLNGHVPISAYLAFLSIFTADLFGFEYISISNERSSNEGNVWYCDQEVNHQYSKTFEFENDLQKYSSEFLPKGAPLYFSFLRPLYELQIAQIFSQFSDHHPVFRSCNRGQKQNIWCGECSKCLFAWTILFPFLGPDNLTEYFGNNLFENEHLLPIAKELLGLSTNKPFDCVGTHEETIGAFYLSIKYYTQNNKSLPELLTQVNHELKSNPKLQNGPDSNLDYESRALTILNDWNSENSLPEKFSVILKKELEKNKIYAPNP